MHSIPYEFRPRAVEDLQQLDLEVVEDLLHVIGTALSRAPVSTDPDEGRIGHKELLYRRGLTKEKRQQLTAAEARDEDCDDKGPGKHAWQYFIIYRPMKLVECTRLGKPHGLMIVRIISAEEVAARYLLMRE
ncbi:hypothetical protein ACFYVE_39405 [Streptomyces tendae]|uniref:hypothetical protein n=1 Tax=Streptomyces TaxID=1883 RepID=UPI0036CEEB9A